MYRQYWTPSIGGTFHSLSALYPVLSVLLSSGLQAIRSSAVLTVSLLPRLDSPHPVLPPSW